MRTIRTVCLFMILFFAAGQVSAQVAMKIELNQMHYLQYEPVFVRIAFKNMSGHPLAFGESKGLQGSIRFDVYPGDRNIPRLPLISKTVVPDMKGSILPPGAVVQLTFRLNSYYDFRAEGRYSVKAVLSHPQLTASYESNTVHCTVSAGKKIWGPVSVGIPDYADDRSPDVSKKIKTRNYTIVSYFTGQVTVYALVIDDKERNYLVRRIGFDLGVELQPKCEIDFLSRLNLLVAASPKVFAFYQYNVDGKLERKQIYIKTSSTPTLVVDKKTGIVMPSGGREARADVDYEEIRDLPFMDDMLNRRRRPSASSLDDSKDDGIGIGETADRNPMESAPVSAPVKNPF